MFKKTAICGKKKGDYSSFLHLFKQTSWLAHTLESPTASNKKAADYRTFFIY